MPKVVKETALRLTTRQIKKEEVVSWNDYCKSPHALKYCTKTSMDRKKEMYEEHEKNRHAEKCVADDFSEFHNALLHSTLRENVSCVLCADGCADINLMSQNLLEKIVKEGNYSTLIEFNPPRKYDLEF